MGVADTFFITECPPNGLQGGTSLSKIFGAINRFSEDVDVTLDYREFEDGFDPFEESASRTAIKKFGERLKVYPRLCLRCNRSTYPFQVGGFPRTGAIRT